MNELRILFVDDEASLVEDLREYLCDYPVDFFTDPASALHALDQTFYDIVIADYKMPEISGLELLIRAKQKQTYGIGVLFTAFADKHILEQMLNHKLVSRFLEKTASPQELQQVLDECIAETKSKHADCRRRRTLEQENRTLKGLLATANDQVIGCSGGLRAVWQQVQAVASAPASVLITGETGTGKEVIARQLHLLSPMQDGPFVKINCAAIPESLLESELFGHEKGAFTHATGSKPGKLELAHQGTLFLDEIGDLQLDLQAKLLTVLQDREVVRVGGTRPRQLEFRLICATNADLELALSEKRFRADLYYRIATFPLLLPPLRDRVEDLNELADVLTARACRQAGLPTKELSDDARERLRSYRWPGNVRELENALMRAAILTGRERIITASALAFLGTKGPEPELTYEQIVDGLAAEVILHKRSLSDVEKALLRAILVRFDGKILKATQETGIPKHRFYKHR